jgi:hypothetical protein
MRVRSDLATVLETHHGCGLAFFALDRYHPRDRVQVDAKARPINASAGARCYNVDRIEAHHAPQVRSLLLVVEVVGAGAGTGAGVGAGT